jgi:hypothetical protein
VRCYLNGVEIDKVLELAEVCALDDWLNGFVQWLGEKEMDFEAIVSVETVSLKDGLILEVWAPAAPPFRAQEIGGILKKFAHRKAKE